MAPLSSSVKYASTLSRVFHGSSRIVLLFLEGDLETQDGSVKCKTVRKIFVIVFARSRGIRAFLAASRWRFRSDVFPQVWQKLCGESYRVRRRLAISAEWQTDDILNFVNGRQRKRDLMEVMKLDEIIFRHRESSGYVAITQVHKKTRFRWFSIKEWYFFL